MLKKQRKIRGRTRLATIKRAQSDTTTSASFLSTDLHSVSQAITRENTNKISIYKNKDTELCADSVASLNMFHNYSTLNTYHRLSNRYNTLGDNTRLPIERIGTAVYTLNGRTILNRNVIHIPALRGPLYSLCNHRQRPGCGFYSSYKYGLYLLFPEFILQEKDSYDNIVSYRSLGASYQGPIDYIEPKSTGSKDMASPSVRPSTINPKPTPHSPQIIPSDEESISSQTYLPPYINIDCLPQPSTRIKPTEPSNTTLHKNSVEPLSIHTLNLFHIYASNLPTIPSSLTPAPCKNRTLFESLNIYRIFGCSQFRNQKHLTKATNASLVNSGLLPSTIGSFATISNTTKGKPTKKRRQFLDKVHMYIVFGDCVALGGHRYDLLLVDVATRYCWLYGMLSLSSTSINSALELFKADTGRLPHRFHSDFDRKLINGNALRWILSKGYNIIATPAGHQSSNGLA